jgi:hypothetical protein
MLNLFWYSYGAQRILRTPNVSLSILVNLMLWISAQQVLTVACSAMPWWVSFSESVVDPLHSLCPLHTRSAKLLDKHFIVTTCQTTLSPKPSEVRRDNTED